MCIGGGMGGQGEDDPPSPIYKINTLITYGAVNTHGYSSYGNPPTYLVKEVLVVDYMELPTHASCRRLSFWHAIAMEKQID